MRASDVRIDAPIVIDTNEVDLALSACRLQVAQSDGQVVQMGACVILTLDGPILNPTDPGNDGDQPVVVLLPLLRFAEIIPDLNALGQMLVAHIENGTLHELPESTLGFVPITEEEQPDPT